jgi:hypothetical protein
MSVRVVAFQKAIANQASGFPAVWAFNQLKICQKLFSVFIIFEKPEDVQGLRR